ncbi:MAG TPA: tetratricopeptide repeat-containing protein [Pyrinomonadaceae bacterium]|nr:tetratricopeptide repeat-containing protein [Pyrinomonadaceae bacterium]
MSAAETEDALVAQARDILRGTYRRPLEILKLAKKLKGYKKFGYARRILARARNDPAIYGDTRLRLEIHQQSALCTYKDPDLPADSRLDRALEILREVEDLSTTRKQETLGLAGAIFKRKWEVDNQRSQLERSLFYYLRGYAEGAEYDQGYTGINAAYILDLLAHQEAEEAVKAQVAADSPERERIVERREQAKKIREEIAGKVAPLVDSPDTNWLQGKWWFYSTVAEAYFGLGSYDSNNYDLAVAWLKRGETDCGDVPEWEKESTARQLAAIARLQAPVGVSGGDLEDEPPWRALKAFLGRTAPVRSAFTGKIGLGLSGGGFRASLFHIGVLAKLAEIDVLRRVEAISCVSGGSIIGAHYYLELKHLLETKREATTREEYRDTRPADKRDWITYRDYIDIVKRVERDFLAGVQRNVRTRVAAEPLTNLRMIFGGYSRTMRAGELYETEIFSRVKDGKGHRPRWMSDLRINPLDADDKENFNPKQGNWRREAKVPILILNAATLNTGHTWHFTATYMGEPPAGIDSQIDGNDRLRRMYYDEAPEGHRCVRLGHAVAASACVQDIFEPLALEGLYPDRVVRLVDGGTCDNQGVGGLLEQDCTVILISDGSGQMESEKDPSPGLLGVPLRSTSILQSRIRQAQYQDLCARRRSRLLRGLMFVHLKNDLDVDPVDWVDCLDPSDTDDDDLRPASRRGKLTRYGIAKDIQQRLASVRTDLDSFSDVEAYALMTSAYRQTEYAFEEGDCVEGFEANYQTENWDFLAIEDGMKGAGRLYEHVKRLLCVSDMLAFKILKLRKSALVLAIAMALVFLAALTVIIALGIYAARLIYDRVPIEPAISATISAATTTARDIVMNGKISVGMIIAIVAVLLVVAIFAIRFFGRKRKGETLIRIAFGGVGLLGSVVAQIHLSIFDKWFLREGSMKKYEGLAKSAAAPCDSSVRPSHGANGAAHARGKGPAGPPEMPGATHAPALETVTTAAAVETLPRVTPARGGNVHAKEGATDGEPLEERADINDPDARQN